MEQEARDILQRAVEPQATGASFARKIHQRFAKLHVEALPIPKRRPVRVPPMPKDQKKD